MSAINVPKFNSMAMPAPQRCGNSKNTNWENWHMAALNIAFEAPDNSRGPGPSKGRPIDLVHLAKQTMGDKVLEIEVLQMFARQARACLQEIGSGNAEKATAGPDLLKG